MRILASILAAVLLTAPAFGQAQKPTETEAILKPVMCAWAIFHIYKVIGDHCFAESDREFRAALDEVIERMEVFIAKNSSLTRAEISEAAGRGLSEQYRSPRPRICVKSGDDPWLAGYSIVRAKGPDRLRAGVTDLLAEPHKPEWQSCV